MLTEGSLLQGRYRVVRLLSRGGMGAVYEAVDERLGSTVALKESFFDEPRMKQQFEIEARLLARLRHPALTKVIDHFSENDEQFLVMEFIAGNDFGEELKKRNGGYPVDHVLLWLEQLLDALDYIHTQTPPVIHRDIKPQNLKLTSRSQIILLDFGLAKNSAIEGGTTNTASVFGYTPHYAALEQIQGTGTDPRSDLYSLAATAYHLMTGTRPPDALSRAAAAMSGEPDPLVGADQITTSIPPAVAAVLAKAMAMNRNERYASAAEMHRALREAASAAGVAPSRSLSSGATVVASAAPTVTTDPAAQAPTVHSQPQPAAVTVSDPPQQKKKLPLLLLIAAAVVVLFVVALGIRFMRQAGDRREVVNAGVTGGVTQPSATTVDVSSPRTTTAAAAGPQSEVPLPAKMQIQSMAATKGFDLVLAGADDGSVLLVRGNSATVATKFGGNVSSVLFAPDERSVIIGVGYDPKIGSPIYRASFDGEKLGEPQMLANVPAGPLGPLALSPDARTLAVGLGSMVRIFDLTANSFRGNFTGHTNAIQELAFSPDGKKLFSGALDGTVRMWDMAGAWPTQVFNGGGNGVIALAASPDGKYVASAGYDGVIFLWDLATGKLERTFTPNNYSVNTLAFDGSRLVEATTNGEVNVLDLETTRTLASFPATGNQLLSAAAIRSDHILAVAQNDGKFVFWKLPE